MTSKRTFISSKYYSMLTGGTISAILVSAVVMSDTIIAGLIVGENGVNGVNLVMPVYALASFFALVFSLGAPIIYSRQIGAFQKEEADRTFGTGLLTTIVIGVILFLLLIVFGDSYFRYTCDHEQILSYANSYLKWMKYVVLLTPVNVFLSGMVFSDGDETISAIANIISGLGNIIISVPLCKMMGTEGLGLASLISLVIALVVQFIHFTKKRNSLRLNLYFSPKIVGNIAKYSIVDSSTYLFLAIFTFCCNLLVVASFGQEMLILSSVIILVKEVQLVFDGIGEAIAPLISLYLGEETYDGVREIWNHAKKTAAIESIVVTGIILLFAPLIIRAMGITDPATVNMATWELRIISLSLFFTCRIFLDSSYYILIDKISLGVLVCALRDLVISLPLATLGIRIGGVYGMAVGLMLAQPLGYLISVLYVRLRYGKDAYPLFISERNAGAETMFYELEVEQDSVMSVRDAIGEDLKKAGYSEKTVNNVMLLVEETLMLINDNNPGKKVLAECSLVPREHITLIIKDDGVIFDLTDNEMEVGSLRKYVISNLAEHISPKRKHFLTLSYNRNVFEITSDKSL